MSRYNKNYDDAKSKKKENYQLYQFDVALIGLSFRRKKMSRYSKNYGDAKSKKKLLCTNSWKNIPPVSWILS